MEDKIEEKRSKLESYKLRATLLLGTVCFVCIFVFLLLVPLVLDPAISTLYHQFVEQPVHCKLTDYNLGVGRANCSWASCREGCTKTLYSCHQIRVVYSKEPFQNETSLEDVSSWVDLAGIQNKAETDTPLLINIKGCGYPPSVICDDFAEKINNFSQMGLTFPCHYSKTDPLVVISSYNYYDNVSGILYSIFIPNTVLVGAIFILLHWACQ